MAFNNKSHQASQLAGSANPGDVGNLLLQGNSGKHPDPTDVGTLLMQKAAGGGSNGLNSIGSLLLQGGGTKGKRK